MSEKYSSIDRVVGAVSDSDKQAIKKEAEDTFEKQHSGADEETTRRIEKEKSPEQIEVIDAANKATNRYVEHFGLPVVNISPRNMHIISKEFWSQYNRGNVKATFTPLSQAICVEETDVLLELAIMSAHEMLHFKSHGALQITTGNEMETYRSGFSMESRDGSKSYFTWLDEAITEELSVGSLHHMMETEAVLKEEIDRTEEVKARYSGLKDREGNLPFADPEMYYADVVETPDGYNWHKFSFTRNRERQMMNLLVRKIVARGNQQLDRYEIKKKFYKAYFNGNVMSVAKMIDGTFGQDTFRKLGEMDDDTEKLEKYVESL